MLLCVGFVLCGREALQTCAVWGKEGHLCGMKPAGHKSSENSTTTARPTTLEFYQFLLSKEHNDLVALLIYHV